MMPTNTSTPGTDITQLCNQLVEHSQIDARLYEKFHVKRGLRNSDGSGVTAGITRICNVHGYVINESEVQPIPGELIYRGYSIEDLVEHAEQEDRFVFEEIVYLLLFGELPNAHELDVMNQALAARRELPPGFLVDSIMQSPSKNIMNKLSRSILSLYSYDDSPEDMRIENEMRIALDLIAKMPILIDGAYQAKRHKYDNMSLIMHQLRATENTAESILSLIRHDRTYTKKEAQLLDTLLAIHADHGGGNNSTFACRVATSSGTDAYAAYASAVNSLKGRRHGGANIKVMQMMNDIRENVHDWSDRDEVKSYLGKMLDGQVFDKKGLIYGMGHAVYSLSDPRERVFRSYVEHLAEAKGRQKDMNLYNMIEEVAPELIAEKRHIFKGVSPNVDFYSGFVYEMLGIPSELYTPLFAIARIAGWSAHRLEELVGCNKIIRPAYKSVMEELE